MRVVFFKGTDKKNWIVKKERRKKKFKKNERCPTCLATKKDSEITKIADNS